MTKQTLETKVVTWRKLVSIALNATTYTHVVEIDADGTSSFKIASKLVEGWSAVVTIRARDGILVLDVNGVEFSRDVKPRTLTNLLTHLWEMRCKFYREHK